MKIDVGVAEVLVAVMTIALSIGGSWIAVEKQVATVSETVRLQSRIIEELARDSKTAQLGLVLQAERYSSLNKSTEDYKRSIEGLKEVLSKLDNTLARMDERLKGLEDGVRSIK